MSSFRKEWSEQWPFSRTGFQESNHSFNSFYAHSLWQQLQVEQLNTRISWAYLSMHQDRGASGYCSDSPEDPRSCTRQLMTALSGSPATRLAKLRKLSREKTKRTPWDLALPSDSSTGVQGPACAQSGPAPSHACAQSGPAPHLHLLAVVQQDIPQLLGHHVKLPLLPFCGSR